MADDMRIAYAAHLWEAIGILYEDETFDQWRSFLFYLFLGPQRTLKALSELFPPGHKYHITINHAKQLSCRYDWVRRCKEADRLAAAYFSVAYADELLEMRKEIASIVLNVMKSIDVNDRKSVAYLTELAKLYLSPQQQ